MTNKLTLLATILGSAIVFLDSTVVNVALPSIQEDLDADLASQLWVVEAYLLTLVAVLLVGGSLGDLYGRRRLFTVGLVGFGVTSALCAIAPSDEFLIGARALQGVAGALLVPGSLAILAATFEGTARGRAIGAWTGWTAIATVAGPAGGGYLIETFSWRLIFWINVPLVIITLLITRRAVAESSDPEAARGVDYLGIGLSAVGLAGLVFALISQPTRGWGDPVILVPLIVGVLSLAAFFAWETRTRSPMLPLGLFKVRNFAVANMATLAVYAALLGGVTFITLFLQEVAGYSPFEAGLATTPVTVLLFLLSQQFGALASRIGPRLPMGIGPIVAGAGLLLLLRVGEGGDYLPDVLPALIPLGVGLGMTVAPLTTTVLDSVEERRSGIASGVNNAISRLAGLLAIAVLGAALSAQFVASIGEETEGLRLGDAGRAAIERAEERPLAGVELSGVPAAQRPELAAAITDSSVSGFHLAMAIAGAVSIAGGLISLIGIRNRAAEEPEAPD